MMGKVVLERKILEKLFLKENYSLTEIGLMLGVSAKVVKRNLNDYGIHKKKKPLRDKFGRFIRKNQVLPDQVGEGHPRYKNGSYSYRGEAERHHKKECFHCGCDKNLHVHHMDEDRTNNKWWNLRWVCGSCHMKVEHKERLLVRDKLGRFKRVKE